MGIGCNFGDLHRLGVHVWFHMKGFSSHLVTLVTIFCFSVCVCVFVVQVGLCPMLQQHARRPRTLFNVRRLPRLFSYHAPILGIKRPNRCLLQSISMFSCKVLHDNRNAYQCVNRSYATQATLWDSPTIPSFWSKISLVEFKAPFQHPNETTRSPRFQLARKNLPHKGDI